ncbi:MAG TPA: DHH family phosphoesterase [Thermoplasmata archaeon]|nr:DHH family phosphoesterase [Thermoplasmata archaeon]
MPSGPEQFVDRPEYAREFLRARALLLSHPGRWRVIYHYDGDGIASASSAIRMLRRLGYPFHAAPLLGVERARIDALLTSSPGAVLVVDTGASWLDRFARHPAPVIVLDHHQYPGAPRPPELPEHVAFVDPVDWGVDGMSEMCAATLTWLFSVFIDPENWDNAVWGVSGAISDRQHDGGFRGLNAKLVEEARSRGLLERIDGLPLFGTSLSEALARSIDPFLRGISGRPVEADRFLQALRLDPHRSPDALDREERARLTDALVARLVQQGTRPEFVEVFQVPRYRVPAWRLDAEEIANRQNATGRAGEPSIGVALALGDERAMARARDSEEGWRTGVLNGLRRIEEGGVNSRTALQWFESPEPTLAGTQAGLAMNYLLDPNRPVVVFSPSEDPIKVSGRGTRWLVGRGLDLATAFRESAAAVGGEGGGHRVASGATIPGGTRDRFLDELDRRIAAQIPLPGAP